MDRDVGAHDWCCPHEPFTICSVLYEGQGDQRGTRGFGFHSTKVPRIPPSRGFMLRFRCDLMSKCSFLSPLWRPAKPQRASRIAREAPKSSQILFCNYSAWRVSDKPRSGETRGLILNGFGMHFQGGSFVKHYSGWF